MCAIAFKSKYNLRFHIKAKHNLIEYINVVYLEDCELKLRDHLDFRKHVDIHAVGTNMCLRIVSTVHVNLKITWI